MCQQHWHCSIRSSVFYIPPVQSLTNQPIITLPSSPVGKSSDLHAGVQQFKSHSGHKLFFFFTYILSGSYSQPYFGQFFYLVCRYLERKNNIMYEGLILHIHVARDLIRKNISGFFIFAFVPEIRPILFPHTVLWGVLATPNQHLLTLPSSPVGAQSSMLKYSSSNPTSFFFFYIHTIQ